ncbi:MAG: TIR domain-containing protein [Chloroflexi bacterium]|nr:MAG: TIR domain-containing protein [Chloroflexota bacterium]
MAHDVFISYSNKDKTVANAVLAGLEDQGIRCWIAPRDVDPGSLWSEAIVNAIGSSKVMIVIMSGNSNNSKQVVREVERAVASEVIIIPFRIENVDPTGAMAYFLATQHWLDALTPPLENHIEKLGKTIQLILSGGDKPVVEQLQNVPVEKTIPVSRRNPGSLTIALLGIAVLALFAVFIWPRIGRDISSISTPSPTTGSSPVAVVSPPPSESPTETLPVPTVITEVVPTFKVIGEYRTSRSANDIFIVDNMLYLANGGDGLVRLNVSNPDEPKLVDTYQIDDAQDVAVDGDYAYVITGEFDRRLVVMKIGPTGDTVTFPSEGNSLSGGSSLYYVTVANGLAHLTGHNYWGILDVKDPLKAKEISSWSPESNSGNPCTAVIDGNIAYIGGGWTGLHIFDISDPNKPELIGRFDTPDWIIGMEISENILYLTLGDSGLLTLDVGVPSRPILMDRLDLNGFSMKPSAAGDTLYVTYRVNQEYQVIESGIYAVDVTDPEDLKIISTYDQLDAATDIVTVDDIIYLTDESRGLFILTMNGN